MTARRPSDGLDKVLDAWPLLGTAYRVALVADEALPIARRALTLVRSEARLARESVPVAFWAAGMSLLGLWILLGALTAGAVYGLAAAGWPLGWAIALPSLVGLLLLVVGALLVKRSVEHLTFIQTRARFRALLEVIDED